MEGPHDGWRRPWNWMLCITAEAGSSSGEWKVTSRSPRFEGDGKADVAVVASSTALGTFFASSTSIQWCIRGTSGDKRAGDFKGTAYRICGLHVRRGTCQSIRRKDFQGYRVGSGRHTGTVCYDGEARPSPVSDEH